jgi:hypothetical protein
VISKRRDHASIDRYLQAWLDRAASEDRGDEELMMLPLNVTPGEVHDWDWEPAVTLSHMIQRGLDRPARAFAIYLQPRETAVDGVTLAFTTDEHVVFGVSVDDPYEGDDRLAFAKELLHRLVEEFDGEAAYIAVEEPPPLVGAHIPPDATRVLFSWLPPAGRDA